ncbi:hypothetical protein H0H92_009196 [Tricholoma furcatifolium]|nr:hypothetical protein H0H92_009196 [Tricholoma furcatifolium]
MGNADCAGTVRLTYCKRIHGAQVDVAAEEEQLKHPWVSQVDVAAEEEQLKHPWVSQGFAVVATRDF